MMYCNMVLGLFGFIAATVLLVWVYGRQPQCALCLGKILAWVALVLASAILVTQLALCTKMCVGGRCPRMMGGMGGMPMMQMDKQGPNMMKEMPPPPPMHPMHGEEGKPTK